MTKSVLHYPVPPYSVQEHTTVDYTVTYAYNNYSLRGDDYNPDQSYDVVLLGDSFFFGQGVNHDKILYGHIKKKGCKVLNLSEIATNPIDYYHKLNVLLRHHLKTRNIVIGLCMGNDFQGIADKQVDEALKYRYRDEPLKYNWLSFLRMERLRYQLRKKWINVCDRLVKLRSNSYRERIVVHDFEHQKRFYRDWIQFFTNNNPEAMKIMRGFNQNQTLITNTVRLKEDYYLHQLQLNDDSVINTIKILNAINSVSRPADVYIVLIPSPHYSFGWRSPKYEKYENYLIKGLNQSIKVINLHGLTTREMHFTHDGHWNENGHQFVADIILQRVLSYGKQSDI